MQSDPRKRQKAKRSSCPNASVFVLIFDFFSFYVFVRSFFMIFCLVSFNCSCVSWIFYEAYIFYFFIGYGIWDMFFVLFFVFCFW